MGTLIWDKKSDGSDISSTYAAKKRIKRQPGVHFFFQRALCAFETSFRTASFVLKSILEARNPLQFYLRK